ncbi:hypothetical protein ACJMK2_009460 [Sinanodonta woodiana]|uniref:THD domain-containing protein n=1 Tax=Sinanodonta woodiana TaxID=1069815 RepID=A0ABD3VDV7_SINWO
MLRQDLDQGESEVRKMTRAFDSVSLGNTERSHQRKTECHDDYAVLMESKQESHDIVQNLHHYEGDSKTFDSSDGSVDSGYQIEGLSHCNLMSKEPHVKSRLGGNLDVDAGKAPIISHGNEIEHECANRQRVLKLKCIHICLSMSVVVNVVLVLAVLLLVTTTINIEESEGKNCDLQQIWRQISQDSLCIPCNNLGSQVTAEDTLFDIVSTCGFKFCCVQNAAMHTFFLLLLQEGYTSSKATTNSSTVLNKADVDRTLNTWRSREIGAHLYANITSLPEKLTWTTDGGFGSAFLRGITLTQESRLMVPRAGYYFIYSVVTFKCQHNSKTHIHLINRQHKGRPNAGVQQLLLRKSSDCGTDGFYTSFLSGVLQLKSNDEISVNLTEDSISSVYVSSLSNFVGGYLL